MKDKAEEGTGEGKGRGANGKPKGNFTNGQLIGADGTAAEDSGVPSSLSKG